MKVTRTGIVALVGAGFLAGAGISPGGRLLADRFGVPQARAEATDDSDLLTLFSNVLGTIRADYVDPVSSRKLVDYALNGMLTGLDPHSGYLTEQQWRDMQIETRGQFGGIGLRVTDQDGLLQVVSPIDGTPAAQAGVQPGDLIVAVDGRTVDGLSLSEAVAELRGPPGSAVRLTIQRHGRAEPLELTLSRQVIHVATVKTRLIGDIGVIRISEFTDQTDRGLRAGLRQLRAEAGGHLRGLVLDLRNDPGGLLDQAIAVSNDFLDHGDIVSTRGRRSVDDQSWTARPGAAIAGNLPVVVLVNNGTASAAEIVAGALQDNQRALVLGQRSFGKGSVQTLMPLPGNGAIRLTTARYYTPNGRSIQDLGIVPNVEVAATRTPPPHFGPEREADLLHSLVNNDAAKAPPPPADLPAAAQDIPKLPPANWPAFDESKPSTDFQLQQALVLIRAMSLGAEAVSR
jgi:carboxyl-terminal processing protease